MIQEVTPVIKDIDVVAITSALLAKHNHPAPDEWKRYLHPDALVTNDPLIQRFLINRAWRVIMSQVTEECTIDIRYCLVDTGLIDDWVRLFESEVIPCILKYSLPRKAI